MLKSCLLLLALESVHVSANYDTEKLGEITLHCEKGWSIYKGNCFKAIDVPMTYIDAADTCIKHGGFLYYAENEIEYFDYVSTLLPSKIWLGLRRIEKGNWKMGLKEIELWMISGWADFQPEEKSGNYSAVDLNGIVIVDNVPRLPFVCKRRACLQGYLSCDLSTRCIPQDRICDGKQDCLDRFDERNCTSSCRQYIKITGTNGSITTGVFDKNKDCIWVLEAPIGRRIRLYMPRFSLEQNTAFVNIHTGSPVIDTTIQIQNVTYPIRSRVIASMTGTNGPHYMFSDDHFIIIRAYSTDVSTQLPSITIGYVTEIPNLPVVGTVENLTATNSWKSQLIPFSADNFFPQNLELVWEIIAPFEDVITYHLSLTAHSGLGVDEIIYKIVDGDIHEILYRHYYTTSNNKLRVTSFMVPQNGDVTLRYIIGCGMDISDSHGTIISPSPIPNNLQCTWNLTGGQSLSRGMALKFYELDIQNDPRTIDLPSEVRSSDKFEIYIDDSRTASTKPVIEYNNTIENIIHAPGGKFKIVFKSDLVLQSTGFKIGFGTDCEYLNLSRETMMSTTTAYFMEDVVLSCPTGYSFHLEKFAGQKNVTLTCNTGWKIDNKNPGPIPECRIVYCGTPDKINNGHILRATGVTYGSVATYICNPGYHMNSGENATCSENGKWTLLPICTFSKKCSKLADGMLSNGAFEIIRGDNFTNGSADFDTVVRFSCNVGYELLGPDLTHCTANGWTHEVQHSYPNCQKLPCQTPLIPYSDVLTNGEGPKILFGEKYNVSCNPGFRFTVANVSTVSLTCQANQTFDQTFQCRDIDECIETTDLCDDESTSCMNTIGSYRCECKSGFTKADTITCVDILECSSGKGGCSDTCVETEGSYYCTCPIGFSLFQGNGINGFYLPVSEHGNKRGDVYHINHTCVPVPCPPLSPVSNGRYLNFSDPVSGFHFNDSVDLQCMDGYEIQGTFAGTTRRTLNCQSNGNWDQLYNCTARACTVPPAPTYGMLDKDKLVFNEVLTLTCNLTETTNISMKTRCIYKNGGVLLGGENVTKCPEIDCGDPDLVMPAGGTYGVKPTTTTYFPSTSKFIFTCKPGFDVTGFSYDSVSNSTVKCKANGRWSFGTLACAGKMCRDPGTPGDAQQIITGYEVGSVLYYSCNRQGFQISGPANYTCQFNATSNVAEWSNGLKKDSASFPKCLDTQKPSFTGDCMKTFNLDKMSPVTFTPGSASDNFAVYSVSRSKPIRSGDVITTSASVTYTATDFNNNVQMCTVNFNVIDRTIKPYLQCPDYVTVLISSPGSRVEYTVEGGSLQTADNGNTLSYNTSSQIVTDGSLVVTPTALSISVAKIGTAETVLAVANNTYGTRSTCTFIVNYKANGCFQDQVFKDENADRNCSNVSSSLVCTSKCKSSYLYKDGTNVKNFTCSGDGSWDYTATAPNDRYCLQTVNPDYEVEVTIRYNFGFLVTGTGCETAFSSAINSHLAVFQTRLSNLCGMSWNLTVISATKTDTFTLFEARLKLTLITTSASVSARQECVNKTSSRPDTFDVVNTQLACDGKSNSLTAQTPGFGTPVTTCALKTYKKIASSVTGGEICVSIGPAEFYDSVSASVMSCPVGQYQDGLAQSSCKTCLGDSYSNTDRTSCQVTCPKGFWSADGFYPCKPCSPDTYWANKTTCTPCPSDTSTVGQEGVVDISKCYPKCPVGSYSLSGYNITGCTLCPRNFYQDQTGQMVCKECNAGQSTSQIGSTANNNCTAINDTCDGTYCNNRGQCDFAYHRRVCTCNQGYFGDQCQYQYHICDGNPCTNGATCNRGASSTQYTCSCRTDLDECSVTVVNTTYIAKATVASMSQTQVANSEACRALCLNTPACQEASYTSSISFCSMYNITLTPDQMILSGSVDVHFRKNCFRAFSGYDCEKDTADQCTNANCNMNAKCMDKITDFQCVCPSAGGYTGRLCDLTFEPCKVNPCVHGTCKAYGSVRYECTCDAGYEGLNCSQEIIECAPHPETCLYGGKCVDHVGGYHCECQNGFGGTRCEQPPNYCATQNCGSGNICYNSIDRMEGVCECDADLFAPRFRCAMNKVENEGAAKPTDNLVDQAVGIDINSCRDRCQNNKDCAAATYQYIPGPSLGYVCYLYNSSYAANITNNVTAFHKNCNAQAYACDRIALPCNSTNCNNGTCQNINNGLGSTCVCQNGFTGSLCQHSIDDCVGNLCQNGATCVDRHLGYNCKCAPGYEGTYCQTNKDDCAGICNTTRGMCEDRVNGYYCNCLPGFMGKNCEIEINECASYPCKHGGNCTDLVNNYTCSCPQGWKGKQCDVRENYCEGQRQCLNGGECFSLDNSLFCRYQAVPPEENFQNTTLVCDVLNSTTLCVNNGACINTEGTARCSCPVDFKGDSCEQVRDWCTENTCKHGGTCIPQRPVGYLCVCAPGYSGVTCEDLNKPCESNPCLGRATCRSSVIDFICQCDQGKTWDGKNCRDSSDDFTLFVDTFYGQAPPKLLTSFNLNTTEISIMMFVRVHGVNKVNNIANLFTLIATMDLDPKPDLPIQNYDFIVAVNISGIYAKMKEMSYKGLGFSKTFGENLHNGDWHHLGIAINSRGIMSVSIDGLHAYPVSLDNNISLAANAQIFLGYGYIAEYGNVTVWDRYLSNSQFEQAFVKEFRANVTPVQGWWNYKPSPSATYMNRRLPAQVLANPSIDVPRTSCEKNDVRYATSAKSIKLGDIDEMKEIYDKIPSSGNRLILYSHPLMTTITWGYHSVIIIEMNETTKNYDECRCSLYIRYNKFCPTFYYDSTVILDNCTLPEYGSCATTCRNPGTMLSAPTPRYIVCGSLGVYDYRGPADNFIMPSCTVESNARYVFAVSVQYQFSVSCSAISTPTNKQAIIYKVKDTLKASNKWETFCDDSACSNINTSDPVCVTSPPCTASATDCLKRILIDFTLTTTSKTHMAAGAGEMSVEDALKVIIAVEKDILLNNIASAVLVDDTLSITMTTQCPTGNSIVIKNREPVCVPCSKGWYYNVTIMHCLPCPKGFFQDSESQTSCKPCPYNSTTYQMGLRSMSDCKVLVHCGPGYEGTELCNLCEEGAYKESAGTHPCQNCLPNYTSSPDRTYCSENIPVKTLPSIVGGVVGGVVGGIAFICVVVFLLVRWTRRKSKKSSGTAKTDEYDTYQHLDSNQIRSSESVKRSVIAPQLPQRPNERRNTYLTPLVNPYLTPFEVDNTHPTKTENAGKYYVELEEIDSLNPQVENMQEYENPVSKSPEAGEENLESQAPYYNESSTDQQLRLHNPNVENMQGTPTEYENTVSQSPEAGGENLKSQASYYNKSSTDEQLRVCKQYQQYQQIGEVSANGIHAYEQLQHQYDKLSAVQPEDSHAYTSL